jgi:hypothetical protein
MVCGHCNRWLCESCAFDDKYYVACSLGGRRPESTYYHCPRHIRLCKTRLEKGAVIQERR